VRVAYELIAVLYEQEFQESRSAERAMTIAAALAELGEEQTWASVWWSHGAIHHDLSNGALAKALELLLAVTTAEAARAAALMLRAEIKLTQALDAGGQT
jgi:hypothetical protein